MTLKFLSNCSCRWRSKILNIQYKRISFNDRDERNENNLEMNTTEDSHDLNTKRYCSSVVIVRQDHHSGLERRYPGGGVLPYMGYIGMFGPKGYGFSAVLVINRVSIIAILLPLW